MSAKRSNGSGQSPWQILDGLIDEQANPIAPIRIPPEGSQVMIAVWVVHDGKVYYRRTTKDFPVEDFATAIRQLQDDLGALLAKETPPG